MQPNEIFELVIKADEKLKYSTADNVATRQVQARELLTQAREEAKAIGNEQLVAQADQRLADLEHPPIAGGAATAEAQRPTPADPTPGAAETEGVPSAKRESPPPSLGTDAIAVLEDRAFMYSNALGDVPRGSVGGLVYADTRFINEWELTIDGQPWSLLRSHTVDYYSAGFFLSNPELDGLPANSMSLRRLRFVGDGMQEEISVHSFVDEPIRFQLRLDVGTDYADLFEIKATVRDRGDQIVIEHDKEHAGLVFSYSNTRDDMRFDAETHVHSSIPCGRFDGTALVWDVELEPRGSWKATLSVKVKLGQMLVEPMHDDFGETRKEDDDPLSRWRADVPRFTSDSGLLRSVFDKSVEDLASLRIGGKFKGMEYTVPAAGLPWFMTLFGRDTLITSIMSLWVGPQLAKGALATMAMFQGTEVDDFRDEEPGKILHEARAGELSILRYKPHRPYYGAADSTQLWLILLHEYWHWTGDSEFVMGFRDNVMRALEWIDSYGDRDGDGYVEYGTKSVQGLGNQCWKDSWDSIQFHDSRIPYLPIATCEIQGYTYDAKVRAAELIERVFGDVQLAEKILQEAGVFRDRFNRDFWTDARGGFYVVGLDGDKNQIDSITSNMGHLLWSGIVPEDRAKIVADRLMSDDLFSGWGVRTMSAEEEGFNPIGYHLGTIWPHDNAIIAMGLARYGFREEANRIAMGLLQAASFSEFRLPEAFAGFGRDIGRFPVPYPTACSPQAWATGAPFLYLQSMLGMEARDGHLTMDPRVPEEIGRVYIHGMHAFGTHWDVEAIGHNGHIRLTR